jgi:hypothetical protein
MRGATDAATLLTRTGIVPDEEVGRAVVDGATRALAPFADDAVRAAVGWAARRWPDLTRRAVLPAIEDALGAAEAMSFVQPMNGAAARRRRLIGSATIAALGAAGGWYAGRRLS